MIVGYQLLMIASSLLLRGNIPVWKLAVVRHALALSVILGLAWWVNKFGGRLARLARDWYSVVTLPLAYRWAGDFVHALFPWCLDGYLYRFDAWLLGAAPAALLSKISTPWFTDLMQLSYCSFFLLISASCLKLYSGGRRAEFGQLTLAIVLSLYATYLLFMLLPAHSPRFEYPSPAGGGPLARLIGGWLNQAAYCGGAFPSGHAAATLAICLLMWRSAGWRSWPFLVPAALILLSTLYGGYHYLADVLAGLMVGATATAGSVIWSRKAGEHWG